MASPDPGTAATTLLHGASELGHLEVVRSLLEVGADVDGRDKDHATPLVRASEEGRFEVSKLLIEHGTDVNSPDLDTVARRSPESRGSRCCYYER